jgi:RNA polymerase sigma-70 factor (ECF subfamily)
MSSPPDEELVARVLAGARDEYGTLVRRHQDALYRYAFGMVGAADAAADLVQDGFVKGFTRLHTCQDPARFAAWMFRIVRNLCLDYLKNWRRQGVSLEDDASFASEDDPLQYVERQEIKRMVTAALETLPAPQREAFLLKHVDDLSYEEMAELTGASVSALKMRVMRAREALHAAMIEHQRVGM